MHAKPAMIFMLSLLCCTPSEAALSNRLISQVKQRIVPAYFQGDSSKSLKFLAGIVDRLDAEELRELDQLLVEANAPNSGELLLDWRLKTILRGGPGMPPMQPLEAILTLPILQTRIEEAIVAAKEVEGFTGEIPEYETLPEYRDLFWKLHVTMNRLRNALNLARYGQGVAERALADPPRRLTDEQVAVLDVDFGALEREISQTAGELTEMRAETRIRAVTRAARILQESGDLRERFEAAFVVDFDGEQVVEFLKSEASKGFSRALLREEGLADSIDAYVKLSRELAGDVILKSRLLNLGMHWWLRGRYGLGPDGFGLLKSAYAVTAPVTFQKQFPLFMPLSPPTPTEPTQASAAYDRIPRFDRRHHYIWMYEYRRLQLHHDATVISRQRKNRDTSKTVLGSFY